ncbi:uncharacterized protein TRIADDRAFT_55110 [Trichoplax adhaerens]|uniref:Uncharacterized protein n=1 Tax=Trichoplax adhaerens TaxID=10228 RepID=B3RU02_TRIAD|nr:predicted protein [Trichoplax adhaerens]EDV25717.1 predicted protein [Trichoplax adhaerens]|eukprot:XP_002111750.1 predicted protein [Trichoplax adhaerens]
MGKICTLSCKASWLNLAQLPIDLYGQHFLQSLSGDFPQSELENLEIRQSPFPYVALPANLRYVSGFILQQNHLRWLVDHEKYAKITGFITALTKIFHRVELFSPCFPFQLDDSLVLDNGCHPDVAFKVNDLFVLGNPIQSNNSFPSINPFRPEVPFISDDLFCSKDL